MSGASLEVVLEGVGFWTTGVPDVHALVEGRVEGDAKRPPAELLPARLRRRSSLLTRLCAEVLEQCSRQLGEDAIPPRIVMSSAWGEIDITVELLYTIAKEALMSPTAFHNSVHNAALGYLSIASRNQRPTTALAAGDAGVTMGALECFSAVLDDDAPCVFIAVEETVPAPFDGPLAVPSVALAWRLVPSGGVGSTASGVPRSRLRLARPGGLDEAADLGHHVDLPWLTEGPLGPMADIIVGHVLRQRVAVSLDHGWALYLEPCE